MCHGENSHGSRPRHSPAPSAKPVGSISAYFPLPAIKLYLYKVSEDLIQAGKEEYKDKFSPNHFFKAKHVKFPNPEPVDRRLNLIIGVYRPQMSTSDEIVSEERTHHSQYPFDHETGLFDELDHTLWYLSRVDSAVALKAALEQHSVFRHFHIILAAGKGLGSGVEAVQPGLDALDRTS